MAGINKAILIGRLGKDPEVRTIDSGRKVAQFSLATTESYKSKTGERVDQTEWHNIVFWGAVVDVIEKYLKKGSQIYIEGRIKTRSYEDKEGVKKYITEIVGDKFTFLGGGSSNNESASNGNGKEAVAQPVGQSFAADQEDDLPF